VEIPSIREVALLVEAGKGLLSTDSILLEPRALLVRSAGVDVLTASGLDLWIYADGPAKAQQNNE